MDMIEARFKSRMTQWDLALRTGISQAKISLIERGYVVPSDEDKRKISEALGYRDDEIFN